MSCTVSSKSAELYQEKSTDPVLSFRVATLADCEAIAELVNSGYRGEFSRIGWTTEEALVGGLRTHSSVLPNIIHCTYNVILMFFDKCNKTLIGCVHLQYVTDEKCIELGMLTVKPDLQARGYGKFILSIAENYARDTWDAEFVKIHVIIQRTELVEFYKRRGFIDTGKREPFPNGGFKFGIPKVEGLEMAIMKKKCEAHF